jgi:hypothetical protein
MALRGYRTCSRLAVLVAVSVVVLAAASCGGGGGDDERGSGDDLPSSAPTGSTSPPTTTVEDAVREAYEAYVAMANRITTTTLDPDDPELARRMVDPALSAVRTNLTTWRTEGQIWVAGDANESRIESVELDGPTAVVTACRISNDLLIEAGTTPGSLPPPSASRDRTTLVLQGEAWVVQYVDPVDSWEGATECVP